MNWWITSMPERRRTRAQERTDDIDISPTALVGQIETLTTERDEATRVADEYLVRKVLSVADDFDRAIEARPPSIADDAWFEGIAAIDRKLRALLESEGVTTIDASPGRPFDPREHEAIANVPGTDRPDGEIVDEVRRGYRLRDRVIRPALVAVATTTNDTPSRHSQN